MLKNQMQREQDNLAVMKRKHRYKRSVLRSLCATPLFNEPIKLEPPAVRDRALTQAVTETQTDAGCKREDFSSR